MLDVTGLRTYQSELHRERDFSGKILSNTQSLILVADTAGLISYANRRWYDAGFEQKELLGRPLLELAAPGFVRPLSEARAKHSERPASRQSGVADRARQRCTSENSPRTSARCAMSRELSPASSWCSPTLPIRRCFATNWCMPRKWPLSVSWSQASPTKLTTRSRRFWASPTC